MEPASEPRISRTRDDARAAIARAMTRRSEAGRLLARDAERIARACHAMAERFHRGGKLIVFGDGPSRSDAEHVSVEFIHPVIVGKRALPAIALSRDSSNVEDAEDAFAHQMRYLAAPEDIAMGFLPDGAGRAVLHALEVAHQKGLLTLAMIGGAVEQFAQSPIDYGFVARSDDPMIVKEIQVTTYHILWELVHLFFEQPGILQPGFIK